MDAVHRSLLRKNRMVFAQDLVLEEVAQILVGENILNDRMVEVINSKSSTFDRNVAFLNKLPTRGPRAFETFYDALIETEQRHLATILNACLPADRANDTGLLANITRLQSTPISPPSSFSFSGSTPSKSFDQIFNSSSVTPVTPKSCIPSPNCSRVLDSTGSPNILSQSPAAANEANTRECARVPVEQMDVAAFDDDDPRGQSSPERVNVLSNFEVLRSNSSLQSLQSAAGILPSTFSPFTANTDNHIIIAENYNHIISSAKSNGKLQTLTCDAPNWEHVEVRPASTEFLQARMNDCYPMFGECKGIALLVNVTKFEPSACLDDRSGGDVDCARLELMFRQLSYEVYKLINGTAAEIWNTLKNFTVWPKLREHGSCFVVLMSHGEEGAIFGRDGKRVNLKEVYNLFSNENCPHLQNKPKVFLVQACRGDQPDKGTDQIDAPNSKDGSGKATKRRHLDFGQSPVKKKLPAVSDCLFGYATVPGYTAMRNTAKGSWFIQAFIQVVAFHARDKSLLDILTMTNEQVKGREGYSPDSEFHRCKEMSEFTSCLCKPFFFFPGIYMKRVSP